MTIGKIATTFSNAPTTAETPIPKTRSTTSHGKRFFMDEELAPKDKLKLVFKEAKVGFSNGFLLGILAIVFLGLYIFLYKGYDIRHAFLISLCVGVSLLLAMIVSSLVGTLVPLFFKNTHERP